jgi:hypothetical protein
MIKNLDQVPQAEVSELLRTTNNLFVEALQDDLPIEHLELLRNCLKEIRAEMNSRESK